jgi:hypothetical protein
MKNTTSGKRYHVALVSTGVAEEHITSTIRVTKISDLGKTLAETCN